MSHLLLRRQQTTPAATSSKKRKTKPSLEKFLKATKRQIRLAQELDSDDSDDEESSATKKSWKAAKKLKAQEYAASQRLAERTKMLDSEDEGDDDGESLGGEDEHQQPMEDDNEENQSSSGGDLGFEVAVGDMGDNNENDDNEYPNPTLRECDRTPPNMQRLMTRNGEARLVMVLTRRWISNATPEAPGRGCAMYLPAQPSYFGAEMLIQDNPALKELALTRGGDREYATKISKLFHKHRRKAKAQYNRSLALALFTEGGPHCIAYNVLKGGNGGMKLSPATAHLGSTDALMNLIGSPMLYTDPAVHKLWVGAHASGEVYGATPRDGLERLDAFLSINYEAHGRLETTQRLKYQGFRHGSTPSYLALQAQEFKKMRKLVRHDRRNNLDQAETERVAELPQNQEEQDAIDALNSGWAGETSDESDDEM
jgi:hypothetical protein